MPTYDYECQSCKHSFDTFQTMSAKPLQECPKCKKHTLKRLIGKGLGVIFKGSGFYTTDYRSTQKQTENTEGKAESQPQAPQKPKKNDASD